MEVHVYSIIRPTERVDLVVGAIERIFPGLVMDIRSDRVEAYDGLDSLRTLHRLFREQKILDTARAVMTEGLLGDVLSFKLNKQAALMGKVNFPPEEEPLGSIHVQISNAGRIIDWLAPKTENGVPIREIDIGEETFDV
jgi:predicted RNA binding protein with dsRBD fold (UPF0201 family)